MSQSCYSAVLETPGKIVLKEFPIPEIGPDDGLLKIDVAGICSTDVKIYEGHITKTILPLIMGHEIVGRIAKVGRNAAQKWGVAEGDQVIVEGSATCGACEACLAGNFRFCKQQVGYGTKVSSNVPPHLWGAYGEYMYLAPGSIVKRVKQSLDPKVAVLIGAVIANGIHWVCGLGQLSLGDTVLIQGMGAQGLAGVLAAHEGGARKIIVSGLTADRDRHGLARRLGADHIVNVEETDLVEAVNELTDSRGVDVVLDVTGSPAAFAKSLDVVRWEGTVVLAGVTGGNLAVPVILDKIVLKQIRVQGAFSKGNRATDAAIAIAESGKYPLEEMVTAEYPLRDCATALEVASGKNGPRPLKVVLRT